MVLRVRRAPARFPTNILYIPVDHVPLYYIPSVGCPGGGGSVIDSVWQKIVACVDYEFERVGIPLHAMGWIK